VKCCTQIQVQIKLGPDDIIGVSWMDISYQSIPEVDWKKRDVNFMNILHPSMKRCEFDGHLIQKMLFNKI